MAIKWRYFEETQDGETIGLIRIVQDDEEKTLTVQRLDDQAEWVDDSSAIDDLREPGVRELTDPAEVTSVRTEILKAQGQTRNAPPPLIPAAENETGVDPSFVPS